MPIKKSRIPAFMLILGSAAAGVAQAPGETGAEGMHISTDSMAFRNSFEASYAKLRSSGLGAQLATPNLGAGSDQNYQITLKEIQAERPLSNVQPGKTDDSYDLIIQPGHYGRTTGHVGTTGHLVSERALNAYLVGLIVKRLAADHYRVLVVPADGSPRGLKSKVFLAIHADGSIKPCSTGPSIAYKQNSSMLAMHAIGFGLSRAYGYNYSDFMRDNFTADEHDYYMFGKVNAPILSGLLEIGCCCPLNA